MTGRWGDGSFWDLTSPTWSHTDGRSEVQPAQVAHTWVWDRGARRRWAYPRMSSPWGSPSAAAAAATGVDWPNLRCPDCSEEPNRGCRTPNSNGAPVGNSAVVLGWVWVWPAAL